MGSTGFDQETAHDPSSEEWMGLSWSAWIGLEEATEAYRARSPRAAGLYRLRVSGARRLIYVGETGKGIRQRLQQLNKGMDYVRTAAPVTGTPHVAAGCVLRHLQAGRTIEVSWALAELDRRERKGVEVDLIAAHRRIVGESPTCQFAGDFAET